MLSSGGGIGGLLLAAASSGCEPLIRPLLDARVSPFQCDAHARTALHMASMHGHADTCSTLLTAVEPAHRKRLLEYLDRDE